MVIDSSALVAVLLEESDASLFVSAIANSPTRFLSAATYVEASLVIMRRRNFESVAALDNLVGRLRISIMPVDHVQALLAREAFRRFGKGRDKAGLNFGNCFSYALAKQTGEPLLFKGNDFSSTDIPAA